MKVEESKYIKREHKKVEMPFGTFYFFNKFLIAELNQGIHFSWDKVNRIADLASEFYGKEKTVVYISNRVNSYSIEPQSWLKFDKKYSFFKASAIIAYDTERGLSVVLEKLFSQNRIQKFTSLDSAIEWALNFK